MPPGFPWRQFSEVAPSGMQPLASEESPVSGVAVPSAREWQQPQEGNNFERGLPLADASTIECAPGLTPDIEEAHSSACVSGRGTYVDPRTGYMVSSEVKGGASRVITLGLSCWVD